MHGFSWQGEIEEISHVDWGGWDGKLKIMLGSGLSGRVVKDMTERRLLFETRQKPDARETPMNLQV